VTDVFDAIRAACAAVACDARHMHLREERLAPLAAALPDPRDAPGPDPAHHWLGHGEDTAVHQHTVLEARIDVERQLGVRLQ